MEGSNLLGLSAIKEGYAVKQIIRKADFGERHSYNKEKGKGIYMFKNESDFSNERTSK